MASDPHSFPFSHLNVVNTVELLLNVKPCYLPEHAQHSELMCYSI